MVRSIKHKRFAAKARLLLLLLSVPTAGALLGFQGSASLGLFTDSAQVQNGAFTTVAAFGQYLHNNPTPPSADTTSQVDLPFDQAAPTATTLYNYDTNRDALAGLLIAKGATGAGEIEATKYQNWRSSPLGSAMTINGTVNVVLWSAMKEFATGIQGSVTVFLRDYNGSTYTEICNGTLTEANWQAGATSWVQKTVSFSCPSYTIAAGNRLEVKLIVNGAAANDMWFAYDTTAYNSRLELP